MFFKILCIKYRFLVKIEYIYSKKKQFISLPLVIFIKIAVLSRHGGRSFAEFTRGDISSCGSMRRMDPLI